MVTPYVIKYDWEMKKMENIEKINENNMDKDDFGLMLREIESLEKFYPCYQSMIKRE